MLLKLSRKSYNINTDMCALIHFQDAPSRADTPVQDGTDLPEHLGLHRHVNVYSHIAEVASLSRSHDRLKTANDQIAALIAVMPRAARQPHSDVSNMSSLGTEV
jgi:hypothetical protein